MAAGDALCAFKAQPIHELKPKDKSKIESLLAYGDRLLVGLSTGSLRIYRVLEPTAAAKGKSKAVELLREEEKFSRRPVQQLAIIKEANLLVSLSDGYVSWHDLQSHELIERLDRTKGASCFAVASNVVKDSDTGVPSLVSRLAVAMKRRLLIWTWRDMELSDSNEAGSEAQLEANVKSLIWLNGERLVAGMDPGFVILDVGSGDVKPIFKGASAVAESSEGELPGLRFAAVSSSGMGYMGMGSWVPRPMATALSKGEVLLAKDVNTLFTDFDGKPLDKRQVPWSLAPEAIGFSYPYLLGLQPVEKGTLQIRNPDTLSLLQTISLPQAQILHVPQPNISLAHAGKGFLVASERTIWRMNAQDYDSQLLALVAKLRFDEALSLLGLLEDTLINDKQGRIRDIKIKKATWTFHQQKYIPALDLFTEAQAPPEYVVALYPKAIAGDLSSISESDDTEDDHDGEGKDAKDDGPQHSTPTKTVFGKLIPGGGARNRPDSDTASIRSSRFDAETSTTRGGKPPVVAKRQDKPLEGNDLRQAIAALNSFLAQARVRVKDHLNVDGTLKESTISLDQETGRPPFANLLPQKLFEDVSEKEKIDWQEELLSVAKLVDTTLFRSYMLASPTLAGSLFRIDNFCDSSVVQNSLYESERYNDLLDFLHGKKLHRQSLEMLAKFGKGEVEGHVPEGLEGPQRTVAYLKHLGPELLDLVLEFVRWPISVDQDAGMSVFTEDSRNAEEMPRERVLDFLKAIDVTLEQRYLEHIIQEWDDTNADHHQALVEVYIKELKDIDSTNAEEVIRGDQEGLKNKLQKFLGKSDWFNKAKTLQQLPKDDVTFAEARAIVLEKIGNHRQALSIYVYQLNDPVKAEDYCNRIYLQQQEQELQEQNKKIQQINHGNQARRMSNKFGSKPPIMPRQVPSEDTGSNVFAILLSLYLRPPSDKEEKRWPEALELLSKHGARLPASSTLDLMPDDLAVAELTAYFRGRIRTGTTARREASIMASLEGVRKVGVERSLLLGNEGGFMGRNRSVRITEDGHCKVCGRRFGATAIRVWPDGTVVHYGCAGDAGGRVATGGLRVVSSGWG
ncbi:hypothetical protein K431DRAFT_266742 [Polychaeton citri CBS 116435]|uniref:CNH domain-containing protein n=1 Tax=Polychaeton citri CBS 116435 TaxID=1314669 RepID=A0A9P4UQ12_9PEZI|nr:hypothetical protein K431DRAFT_266742 [Polychaeton citri CBS 116435]